MRRIFSTGLLLLLALAVGPVSAADAPAPGEDFLAAAAKAAQVAEGLKSYAITSALAMENKPKDAESGMKFEAEIFQAGIWPDHVVSVISSPVFEQNIGTTPEGSWFFISQLQACYKGPSHPLTRNLNPDPEQGLSPEAVYNFLGGVGDLMVRADMPQTGEVTTENLEVGGRTIPCQVFHVTEANGDQGTFWVDPVSGLALKTRVLAEFENQGMAMVRDMTTTVLEFSLNEDVAKDKFTAYTPPANIRVVDNFDLLLNPDSMVGQMAPDIEFTDFKGVKTKLADYRGKIVFLDFWATWCGPCRMEMPHIQTLHDELSPAGEVVFLGASSEAQPTIETWLTKNPYSFPIFMVNDMDAKSKFKVTSIPAGFVIDRQGRIKAHMIGAQSEAQLRAALAKAGL